MADFYKYHGLGNDYLVIDPNKLDFKLEMNKKNIKLICDQHFGIGSDGIVYGPIFQDDRICFKIFNPDGSEAEKSGNGIRIFSQYLWDNNYKTDNNFEIFIQGEKICVELIDKSKNLIKVNLGKFSFKSDDIPTISGETRDIINESIEIEKEPDIEEHIFKVTCVNIGNPHCVIIQDEISKNFTKRYGPVLENHFLFPNRVNVQFVKILDESNIKLEIWERGAGYTLASGSSSAAAVCAAHAQDLVKSKVTVHMQGGKVDIEVNKKNVYLTGTVARIVNGNFLSDFKNELIR